jgi:hypothetical protein
LLAVAAEADVIAAVDASAVVEYNEKLLKREGMALCCVVFEYFAKFDDTRGEMYLSLSNKLRFLITEAAVQEEEEHSFLTARPDEDNMVPACHFAGQLLLLPLQQVLSL